MNPVYSVVVPCYNEEDCLLQTHARLSAAMQGMDEPYEIIYINDGSRDKTPAMLDDLAARDARKEIYTDAPVRMETSRMKIQGVGLSILMDKGELALASGVKAKIY